MEQFNLDTWLQDKSRKVVTSVCWDLPGEYKIIGVTDESDDGYTVINKKTDGTGGVSKNDLFFADEEDEFKTTMISFSHAMFDHLLDTNVKVDIKEWKNKLLDLARKELFKEQEHCVIIPEEDYYEQLASQYHIGHEDALKSLPKWKKVDSNPPKVQYNLQGKRLYKNGEYYIELSDLEALSKEE